MLLALALLSIFQAQERRPVADPVCVDVWVEGERAPTVECLNARLRASAAAGRERRALIPGDTSARATSGRPEQNGTFSQSAVAQRLGAGFGQGVAPVRPTSPVHHSPLIPAPLP